MDVVLIQPPLYKRRPNKRTQPSLGLLSVGSYMLAQGLDVKVIDGLSFYRENHDIVDEALSYNPAAIGITTVTEDRFNAIEICELIKSRAKDKLVFVGGPHFSHCAGDALENVPAIDIVVQGEGDITGFEVVNKFLKEDSFHDFHDIDGCAFRDRDGSIISTRPREVVRNLGDLPAPAWNLFDLDKYQGGTLSVEETTRAIGVISSRGCPYRCIFCANSLNRRVRYRAPETFVDELEFLHREYDYPGLNIQDDSFTSRVSHVKAICNEIIRRGLKLRWYCSLRVDKADEELLGLMKEAGCVALGYGIESGSDRVLKRIRKGISTEMIEKAIRATRKVGIEHVSLFLMCSHPGENLKDIRRTSFFVNNLYNILRGTSEANKYLGTPTIIYPGTELEQIALENANVFENGFSWKKYSETDRACDFGPSRNVVYFENPYLSLREILDAFMADIVNERPARRISRLTKAFFSDALAIGSLKDVEQLIQRCQRFARRNLL